MTELFDIFLASVRDGFVQVSAFVAVTVLAFSYLQYRTDGRLVRRLEENRRAAHSSVPSWGSRRDAAAPSS
nr:putative manganese transporter [Halogeometricum sp. CBA1124]